MVTTLKWCCSRKEGINLIEPNENLSAGYIQMAENAIGTMNREKNLNLQFAISACYYSMYYSLYSVLMRIGVKCEIHTCTLEFMKSSLLNLYSKKEYKTIYSAFDVRNTSQYYVDKIVDKAKVEFVFSKAPTFLSKTKSILAKINEKDIQKIRKEIETIIKS